MALSALEIYKYLPKTNCRKCNSPTCLAFAMRLASKKGSLDECPYVTEEGKKILESASSPPIKLVTIGDNENKLQVGQETVMFRHEETFHHPVGIAILIEDTEDINEKIDKINNLKFERIGEKISVNLIAIKNSSGNSEKYLDAIQTITKSSSLPLILISNNIEILDRSLGICSQFRPLIYGANLDNYETMANLAKKYVCPLAIIASSNDPLEEFATLTTKITKLGVSELVLSLNEESITSNLFYLTQIRKLALKKNLRALGYPVLVFTKEQDSYLEAAEISTYICKYAGIIIMKSIEPYQILPILTLRQNIYTDPQKPTQVEAKVYPIRNPDRTSPILITTNFSITYFTVEGDVESSRIPSYILVVNTEGQSVLTAWAAEKFTPEIIIDAINKSNIKDLVDHHKIIIPGYVAVLSGKLEELSGLEVIVGPRESSAIPSFLKTRWK